MYKIYIRFLPSVVNFTSVMGYTDNHTLLKGVPLKSDQLRAADEINATLWHFPSLGSSDLWILLL